MSGRGFFGLGRENAPVTSGGVPFGKSGILTVLKQTLIMDDLIIAPFRRYFKPLSKDGPMASAAFTKPQNSGWGRSGRLLNSGWNWAATNQG